MKLPFRSSWVAGVLLAVSPANGGERFTVSGYAKAVDGGVMVGLNPASAPILKVGTAPLDRHFVPPGRVRWEVELTGIVDAAGVPEARAVRTAPADYAWPAGEEMSPARYAGASNAMNPFENPADPLGVAPGGPPDYDQDGVPDEEDAFPGDPDESADNDGDGIGDNADPDDDNDGMPDVWEIQRGLNPLVADGHLDSDSDGFTNFQEYEADTHPRNGSSRPTMEIVALDSTTVRVGWLAMPGRRYSIWKMTTLSVAPQLLSSGIVGSNVPVRLTRDYEKTGNKCFYILKAEVISVP